MAAKGTENRRRVELQLHETATRIRRYSLDPRLRQGEAGAPEGTGLQDKVDEAWTKWMKVWEAFYGEEDAQKPKDLFAIEKRLLEINRDADLIQKELIQQEDFDVGMKTLGWLALTIVALTFLYLVTHGVRSLDFTTFEPLPEWGPVKYVEVTFWSLFGCLCSLLWAATYHLTRRDFDRWYQPWYISTLLRAPFLTVILMIVVLEFVEWYGEDSWIGPYLLEEGNKTYFIAFTSFSLGLLSEETSAITRQLAEGVVKFVSDAVTRVSDHLKTAISPTPRR